MWKDAIDPRGLCGAAVKLRKAATFSYAPLGDFESVRTRLIRNHET